MMARKKQPMYGVDTLKRVQLAWNEYRDKTGSVQADGAKALGMGVSGFNQYLRGPDAGGVSLNTNFIMKFAALVGKEPKELAPEIDTAVSLRPTVVTLQVRLTLAGRRPKKRSVLVESVGVIDTESSFAVEVDVNCGIPGGAMLIVTKETPNEGDLVLIDKGVGAPVFGQLNYDVRESQWWVAQTVGTIVNAYTIVDGDIPLRVTGVQYVKQNAARTFNAA